MPTAIIELNDDDGVIVVGINMPGGFDPKSAAHNATARVMEYLDGLLEKQPTIHDTEPRLVKTMDQINAIKAATLARQNGPEIVLAG